MGQIPLAPQSLNDRARFNARRSSAGGHQVGFCYWHVSRANAASHQTISLPQIPKFKAESRLAKPGLTQGRHRA